MSESRPTLPPELESRIREIAIRLRRGVLIRGWMRFGLCTLALTLVLTLALLAGDRLVGISNIVLPLFAAGEAAALVAFVILPARRKVGAGQVARFIDERHPELEDRILSAVEFSGRAPEDGVTSAWMIERCLEEARVRVGEIRWGDLVDTRLVVRLGALALFFILLSAGVVLMRSDLWLARFPSLASFVTPMRPKENFTVEPGNARLRKGESQVVWVKSGLTGRKVDIQWREPGGAWMAAPMNQGASEAVHHHQFAMVQSDTEYRVKFGGEISPEYKLTIWSPPQVEAIDLTYHYPEYLGRPSRETPNSGNITAVEGTRVEFSVQTNKPLKGAEIALESGEKIALRRGLDTVWTGSITLKNDDKYQVELVDLEEAPSEYNRRYDIKVQPDLPPQAKIEFPRGDTEVTILDEVPVNFEVEDDFGLEGYGLRYEVAGKEPKLLALAGEGGAIAQKFEDGRKAGGSHVLQLENLGLTAGDLVSWTVWAKDRKPGRDEDELLSDIYFLEVRPFGAEFEEAESDMQGMEGMSGENQEATDQKEIIIAAWNLKRRAKSLSEETFAEQKTIIMDSQRELEKGLQQAVGQKMIAEEAGTALLTSIAAALSSLKRAKPPSPGEDLGRALVEMQKAYSLILKQKPERTQVQNMKSDGSGQPPQMREDVAELEMDQNRNFYEEEKKTTRQEQEATEQVRSKIKELAQRQKLIHAEIAKIISEMKKAQSEEELEKLKRRLESLREEERKAMERLDELQRDIAESQMDGQQSRQASSALEDVRQQMSRTLDNMQKPERLQQARLSSTRALDRLQEMDENLQNVSRAAAKDMMEELQKEMGGLVEKQRSLAEQVKAMQGSDEKPTLRPEENADVKTGEMLERKSEIAREFKDLMNGAGDLAEKTGQSQELLSRKLGDWLRETAAEGILEDMESSELMIEHAVWPSAIEQEEAVAEKLAKAQERLGEAAQALVEDDLEGMQKALAELQAALDRKQDEQTRAADGAQPGEAQGSTGDPGQPDDPKSREIRRRTEQAMQRAQSFMRNGKPDEAARQLEQALEKDSHNADARNQLGLARAQMGELEKAIEEFKQALADEPGHEAAASNLEKVAAMREAQEDSNNPTRKALSEANAAGEKQQEGGSKGQSQGETQGESPGGDQKGSPREVAQAQEGGSSEGSQPGGEQQGNGQQDGGSQPGSQGEPASTSEARGSRDSVPGGQPGGMRPGGGNRSGGDGGTSAAAGWESWQQQPSPRFMDEFMQRGYQEWIERMRDAESLLPRDGETRANVERIRGRVEEMRQEFKRHSVAPHYDLFLNDVIKPAAETAGRLEREIREALKQQEFLLTDEGEIPAQYRRSVADYFESLSRLADAEN